VFEAGIAPHRDRGQIAAPRPGDDRANPMPMPRSRGDLWLVNANIPEYLQGGPFQSPPQAAPQACFCTAARSTSLPVRSSARGMTLVPLKLYFNEKGRAKIELAPRPRQEAARQAARPTRSGHGNGNAAGSCERRVVDEAGKSGCAIWPAISADRESPSESSSCLVGAGAFAASARARRFTSLMTTNRTNAMIAKLMTRVRKFPHASTAPCFLASTSVSAVTLDDNGMKWLGEVEPAGHSTDNRHQDIRDQRLNDAAECGADDDPHRQIDDVPAATRIF